MRLLANVLITGVDRDDEILYALPFLRVSATPHFYPARVAFRPDESRGTRTCVRFTFTSHSSQFTIIL